MTRMEAERLRQDDRHWHFGVVYCCRQDPRVVVRNRFVLGWTWNFGHRWVIPTLVLAIVIAIGPFVWLAAGGVTDPVAFAATFAGSLLLIVLVAYRIASGPRSSSTHSD